MDMSISETSLNEELTGPIDTPVAYGHNTEEC